MARQKGTLRLGSNLEPQMNAPLDAREVVALKADLTDTDSFPYFYVGMTVFVKEEKKKYTLIGDDPTDIDNWQVDAASSSGGGDATFSSGLTVGEAVGGLKVGDTYAAGDDIEDLLRAMLDPLKYPTLTSPSVKITQGNGNQNFEHLSNPVFSIRAYVDNGTINPAYGTSGVRNGAVDETSWELKIGSDGTVVSSNGKTANGLYEDWSVTITPAIEAIGFVTVSVDVASGEQPKDSHGNDYDVPWTGQTLSNTHSFNTKFNWAVYANVEDITKIEKQPIQKKTEKEYTFAFPAATVTNPEMFAIPQDWIVSKIEVLNDLSGKYEDCASEFTVTENVDYRMLDSNEKKYKEYRDNRGYAAGPRTIKLTLSTVV